MTPRNEFGQERPTEEEALEGLAELVGRPVAEYVWDLAVGALGFRRPVDDPAELRRVVDELMTLGDLMRVAGRSTKVRVTAYEALSRSV
jgi:hypothetical protein